MADSTTSPCVKSTASVSNDETGSKPKRFTRKPSPQAKCRAKAGDVNAGVLLCQIEYRFKAGDTLWKADGDLWIAQTRECWCDETGLTLKQYKRAKNILVERKLIKVSHKKIRPHHQWQTTFIRLPESVDHTIHAAPMGSTPSGPPEAHCTVDPPGTLTEGEDKEGENGKGTFADKPQKTKNKKSKKEKNQGKKKSVTCKEIQEVWLSSHAVAYPDKTMTSFAGPDWNYANILIEKLGDKAPIIIEAVVTDWISFLCELKHKTGLYDQGDDPCLKKIAHNAEVALNWWEHESPPGGKNDEIDNEEFVHTLDDEEFGQKLDNEEFAHKL